MNSTGGRLDTSNSGTGSGSGSGSGAGSGLRFRGLSGLAAGGGGALDDTEDAGAGSTSAAGGVGAAQQSTAAPAAATPSPASIVEFMPSAKPSALRPSQPDYRRCAQRVSVGGLHLFTLGTSAITQWVSTGQSRSILVSTESSENSEKFRENQHFRIGK